MFALTVSEFWRNAKRNIPLVILISGMAMVLVMIFSIIRYQYEMYYPFAGLQGQEGFFYMGDGEDIDWASEDETAQLYQYYLTQVYASEQLNTSYLMVASPEWIWSAWEPRLESGRWFSDADAQPADADAIPVVVGGSNAADFPAGSVIACYSDSQEALRLYVIGTLMENTNVLGSSSYYHAGKVNYQMYYSIPYEELFFIAQQELLEQKGVECLAAANTLVVLENPDSEREQELWDMLQRSTGGVCITLTEFNEANRSLLLQEVITYLPLLVTGLILILVCTYAVIYVNQSRGEKHHSVFYLVGADGKRRFLICMGNSLGIVLLSMLLCICVLNWLRLMGVAKQTFLKLDGISAAILAVFYLCYIVLTGLASLASLKGMSPKEALIRKGQL